jgi:Mce-associated membrane protein
MAARRTDGVSGGLRTPRGDLLTRALRPLRRLRRRRALSAALVAATALTTALSVWLSLQLHDQREADQRRQDVLAAARQSALNFTSLDYRHYDRDSANVLKGATGDFRKEFAAQTEQLTKLVAENRSVSQGQVLEAGIVRSDAHAARVLVVADSKVTNTAVPAGEARTYRLQLDLVYRDGRWLTSDVEFVG